MLGELRHNLSLRTGKCFPGRIKTPLWNYILLGDTKGPEPSGEGSTFTMRSVGMAAEGAELCREEAETGDRGGNEDLETGITGIVTP